MIIVDRSIYFSKYYEYYGGGGMAVGEKNENRFWGKIEKEGERGKGKNRKMA